MYIYLYYRIEKNKYVQFILYAYINAYRFHSILYVLSKFKK